MSETLIYGYLADLDHLAQVPGSADLTLRDAIIRDQADTFSNLAGRFGDDAGLLSAPDALTMLINGHPEAAHSYELRCVVEPILDQVATKLDDDTEERSLWFNQGFWIEDFEKIFTALGLTVLATRWADDSLPLPFPPGDHAWPTFTTLRRDRALAALRQLENLDFVAFDALPDALFLDKADEDEIDEQRDIMKENLLQLRRWLETVTKPEKPASVGLVLLFDGDS